ncbi:hypothetical protein TWF730_004730 [Orbilia blumenaviensis]|uniref:Uncharacterized protein n=1 Tax=Orbilia blumenaviensis TaxID=1796055 RepID=A0AAV9U132_9PEZI
MSVVFVSSIYMPASGRPSGRTFVRGWWIAVIGDDGGDDDAPEVKCGRPLSREVCNGKFRVEGKAKPLSGSGSGSGSGCSVVKRFSASKPLTTVSPAHSSPIQDFPSEPASLIRILRHYQTISNFNRRLRKPVSSMSD